MPATDERPRPAPARRRRPGPLALMVGGVVVGALSLAACGDTASQAVDRVVDQASTASACGAVSEIQDQLDGIDVSQISPSELSQLRTGAEFVSTALDALPDGLPGGVDERLTQAQQQLDTAADGAGSAAQDRASSIDDALSGYADQLDDVASELGC